MAIVTRGSCIGVKFRRSLNPAFCSHRDPSQQYCIHNGRFMWAVVNGVMVTKLDTNSTIKPQWVVINHAGGCAHGVPRFRPLVLQGIVDIKLTPAFDYRYPDIEHPGQSKDISSYCLAFRPGSKYYQAHRDDTNLILPTQCFSVCYRDDQGQPQAHNGRYLYWEDSNHQRHCVLHLNDKPSRIWYSHMIFNAQGKLVPQLTFREHITGFRRIPLMVGQSGIEE